MTGFIKFAMIIIYSFSNVLTLQKETITYFKLHGVQRYFKEYSEYFISFFVQKNLEWGEVKWFNKERYNGCSILGPT